MSVDFEGYFGSPTKDDIKAIQDNAEFNALLEKSQKNTLESKLQVTRVGGGYTKKSVEEFAAEMRQNLIQVKTQLERQIMELAAEKASITQECNVLRTQLKTAVDALAARNQTITNPEDASRVDALLSQKENEITQLKAELDHYKNECSALNEKYAQLEEKLQGASDEVLNDLKAQNEELEKKNNELLKQLEDTDKEMAETKNRLEETTAQLEEMKQRLANADTQLESEKNRLKETEARLEEKKHRLDETQLLLEEKEQYLDKLKSQLESEKTYLKEAREQLEEKKQKLDEIQVQLEQEKARMQEAQEQLELKNRQVQELKEKLESEIEAKEFVRYMLTKDYDCDDGQSMEEWLENGGSEKLFESLYMHFTQLKGKIEHQQSIIAEKDQLLERMKALEAEAAALRQENENSKATINSLKKSFEKVMAEMDEQTETLNVYIARSRKDREMLKSVLNERHAAFTSGEAEAEENQIKSKIEKLEEDNAQLEEAVLKPYNKVLSLENAKKIIPKDTSEDSVKAGYEAIPSLNKAADI
jgi:chromosome segregation ATPase